MKMFRLHISVTFLSTSFADSKLLHKCESLAGYTTHSQCRLPADKARRPLGGELGQRVLTGEHEEGGKREAGIDSKKFPRAGLSTFVRYRRVANVTQNNPRLPFCRSPLPHRRPVGLRVGAPTRSRVVRPAAYPQVWPAPRPHRRPVGLRVGAPTCLPVGFAD